MKKRLFSIVLCLCMMLSLLPTVAFAAVTTDNEKTAAELVQSLMGTGITPTGISMAGAVYSISGAEDDLGMDSGIMLDTGSGADVADPDLALLIAAQGQQYGSGSSYSTSTLQFSMTATGSLLNFRYVFASSEFTQNPRYNDVFGLFVSVNGGNFENIAYLDNNKEVTITNLRAGRDGTQLNSGMGSISNIALGTQYDYFTVAQPTIGTSRSCNGVSSVFTAEKAVSVGDSVTVKFVIADVGDNGFNSYVAIEAGSLSFEAPSSAVDYTNEKLGGLEARHEYAITVGSDTYNIVTAANGTMPLAGTDKNNIAYNFIGKSISVVRVGGTGEDDSEPQTITVASRPAVPAVNAFTKSEETIAGKTDASLSGVTDAMEYKIGRGEWTTSTGDKIENPGNETISVRVKATETAPCSAAVDFTYTASTQTLSTAFNTNGGSTVNAIEGISYGARIAAPAAPVKAGCTFLGWYKDAAFTTAWVFANDTVCANTTFYAKWAVNVELFGISGRVFDYNNLPVAGATVKAMRGDAQIGETVTSGADGSYSFTNIASGTYNVVVTNARVTQTILVIVDDSNAIEKDIIMPNGDVNSLLRVVGMDTPDIVVDGLADEAESVSDDHPNTTSVIVEMTVEAKPAADVNGTDKSKIEEQASDKAVDFIEIKVEQTITGGSAEGTTLITNTNHVMEIIIPYDLTGKSNVVVYRRHGNEENAQEFTEISTRPGTDGQFYLDRENNLIYVYANKFSTYAIAYRTVQPVTGVVVTPDAKTFTGKGETVQLTANVLPADADNRNVTWVSSDTGVATVDANGIVTAVGNGTATITATTEDGEKTDESIITVRIPSSATVKPNTGLKANATAPKTEDPSNTDIWTLLMLLSVFGMTSLYLFRKKESDASSR